MHKFLLSLTLLLSCLCQAKLEILFNELPELAKMLRGKAKEELTITISESDVKFNPNWENQLTQTIKSVAKTHIDLQLELPESVTKIGSHFLRDCTGLISFNLPASVTKIDYGFLFGCTGLISFELPPSVTQIKGAFLCGCTGLTSVELPKSTTEIGSHFLRGCKGLASVDLPEFVTKIGYNFLRDCTGLTSVDLPKSTIEIGSHFLYGCTGLTSVELPKSTTEIGNHFLRGCKGLSCIRLSSSLVTVPDSFLLNLKNTKIHLILDRIDNIYFCDPNKVSNMNQNQQKILLKIKGNGHILWNDEEVTPKEIYKKGYIINLTVPNTCTLYLVPKKWPKKPVVGRW
jgi:hypothetical protein